ncbi:hypothetical protein Agabi119p4_2904 [Agaricus bisporus var. burnettii]|uniref:Phosphoglycerate mutase-like protein n=1 Tax=Agaricus bisporus var. burnettii TaxID=192524 RepID=A0A8H7F6B1_AGABI|nr:hypothetical protein Agabi119p4_2904 [Agaricus bisporus var. burnettii]
MPSQARVYLVRHGETDGNRNKIIQGQLDIPLNKIGLEQAARVADVLRVIKFDVALSSDLSRAKETAAAILREQPGLALQEQEDLRERFMGDLEGHVYGTRLDGRLSTMETGPAFAKRTLTWWRKNIVEYTATMVPREEPYNILAVSHGGFLGTLVKNLVGAGDLRLVEGVVLASLPNASVSLIEWDGRKGKVIQYGEEGHLRRADRLDQNVDELPI